MCLFGCVLSVFQSALTTNPFQHHTNERHCSELGWWYVLAQDHNVRPWSALIVFKICIKHGSAIANLHMGISAQEHIVCGCFTSSSAPRLSFMRCSLNASVSSTHWKINIMWNPSMFVTHVPNSGQRLQLSSAQCLTWPGLVLCNCKSAFDVNQLSGTHFCCQAHLCSCCIDLSGWTLLDDVRGVFNYNCKLGKPLWFEMLSASYVFMTEHVVFRTGIALCGKRSLTLPVVLVYLRLANFDNRNFLNFVKRFGAGRYSNIITWMCLLVSPTLPSTDESK